MKKEKELTEKQKKFAEEYLLDFNGARAAREAGYSEKTADRIAYENLRKPEIIEYLNKLQEKKKEKFEIDEEKVMNELSAIAFSRITDYVQISKILSLRGTAETVVTFTATSQLNDLQIAAISEIQQSDKGAIKIKLENKIEALRLIGKQIGMFKDKVDIDGKVERSLSEEEKSLLEKINKRLMPDA